MIKTLELFSGYGGASFALAKAGIEFKCIGYSDIEQYANYIFDLNHGGKALGDVTKINAEDLEDFDLLTGGFPCQSFSIAGKRQGFEAVNEGKLFFEIIRIARIKKPRWMLLENVEGILSHDDGKTFEIVLMALKEIGYKVIWKKLYSKQHGTPQNRPRIWFACFREQEDADKFMFPETEPLKITVKDLLENEVDKKYYLNEKQLENIEKRNRYGDHKLNYGDTIHSTLCSIKQSDVAIIPEDFKSQSLCVAEPLIAHNIYGGFNEGKPRFTDSVMPTIQTPKGGGHLPIINTTQWRRLTPRECFRLQGFFNDEIKFGNLSDNKLYFLAGNGWDINVASKIFIQMFKGNRNRQQNIFNF
jgi:DNA (cytosine-5)-methyltransferase 1